MQRILVMGPPGAGKSTFARKLAGISGLPLFHLDQENWQPGWVPVPEEELQRRVRLILEGERWIIDGNYGGNTMEQRLARADTLFMLDLPRWTCRAGNACSARSAAASSTAAAGHGRIWAKAARKRSTGSLCSISGASRRM